MATNPFFQSQANPGMGFYGNPNLSMANGTGWGIDPSLMTPSYMAPYRPQMQGANAYAAYSRPSFMGGVSQLVSPFNPDPIWGNPVYHNQAAINSVATKPFDGMASLGQRFIVPAITMGMATRALGPNTGSMMGDMLGMFTGKGIAGSVGKGIGAAAGGALDWALGTGSMLGGAGSAIGGAAGAILGPMAVGIALSKSIDAAVFQPYLNTRRTANELQRNFAGITFGDARGNVITGRGLGGAEAARIAGDINSYGMRDMTFSQGEYSSIASMSMRAGLMDNIGSGQIAGRVKDIAAQVKMILSISKDPNVQSAIEELSKLRLGGASVSGGLNSIASGAYRSIGISASIAGASVQHIMNTAGAQGGLMYQMNGMTPYMGMVAAANIYGSFANAQRLGIIGDAQMARMGGLSGAMQSSMGGQISAMMTPFAQMAGMNQYVFGARGGAVLGGGTNVSGVASAFGAGVAGNPIQAQGAMSLYGPMMAARMLKDRGGLGTEELGVSILRASGQRGLGAGGNFTAEQVSTALQSMGLSSDQIQAVLAQRAADSAPGAAALKLKAINASDHEDLMQYISQNSLQNTRLGRTIHGTKSLMYGVGDTIASVFGRSPAVGAGMAEDAGTGLWHSMFWGGTVSKGSSALTLEEAGFTKNSAEDYVSSAKGLDIEKAQGATRGLRAGNSLKAVAYNSVISDIGGKINSILQDPSHPNYKDALTLSSSGADSPEGAAALSKLLKASGMSKYSSDPEAVKYISSALSKSNFSNEVSVSGQKVSSLDSITGLHGATAFDNWKVMGQAVGLLNSIDIHGDDADLLGLKGALAGSGYGELRSALGKDANDPAKALARLKAMARGTLKGGYAKQSEIAAKVSNVDQLVASMSPTDRRAYSKATAAEKSKIIDKYIAKLSGGASGVGGDLPEGASTEEILGAVNVLSKSAEATRGAAQQAASNVDYSSFVAISKSMEGSADTNIRAAFMQLEAARINSRTAMGSSSNTQDGRPKVP